ncbi:A24 family peptidase [Streptomyces sp. NPDC004647]|uniref:A24 family peptidase n=1 Tax=Streptomyces sp. NPDC004647 TaxID=3154671 RepID=UPI0033A80602
MHLLLTLLAAGYGALSGLLVPRVAYRLAVDPGEQWRTACPDGHPLTGPARGWLGLARCAAPAAPPPADAAPADAAPADAAPADPPADPPTFGAAPADAAPAEDTAQAVAEAGPARATRARPAGAPEPPREVRWYGPRRATAPVITALLCAVLAAAVGPSPELAVWLLLTPAAVVLALVDGGVHRLPDVLTLPLAAAAALLLAVAALLPGHAGSWPRALAAGLVLAAVYGVLFLINPDGMGFGDVKLALSLGIALGWYGWAVLLVGALAGFFLGALYGAGLMLLRRADRKSAMPFGPFMVFGTLLGLLLGGLGAS